MIQISSTFRKGFYFDVESSRNEFFRLTPTTRLSNQAIQFIELWVNFIALGIEEALCLKTITAGITRRQIALESQ